MGDHRDARLYFRPTGFVDAPFGLDGRVLRLAGGLLWFSAVEVIAVAGGRRVATDLLAVEALPALIGALSPPQREAAERTIARIVAARPPLRLGERTVRLDQPQVMAILNMTPDSFSDGGRFETDPEGAAASAVAMAAAGAAIIDVGGESTRPRAETVWEGDEIARTLPVIERLARSGTAVSIDTRKAAVMEAALGAGAHLVNDVSALLYDPRSAGVVAHAGCPVVLMHHQGTPETMQDAPRYADALIEVYDWLEARIEAAVAAGISHDRILIDPGIGFGKKVAHSLMLVNGLSLLHGLGCPIVLGASRKRVIGALSNEAPVEQRLGGSIALALAGVAQGVQLLRVHDVVETVQAVRGWRGLRDQALTPG
ncbi:dihydropteroate synthase [Sphingomonas solaris]|uniref:dihydropteroate synthase n=1 Tax=Alterirhizorhabdus solaris TaxID=2529389 RepID=A0A558R7X9_9SPHN|nr:dihydropteroate synthase [Sphingomonas solaris]